MPTDEAKTTNRPSEPALLTEDSVATLLKSMPAQSASQHQMPSHSPAFVLDSMTEKEPVDSVAFTWFVRIVVGTGLAMAAVVAGWLTISSVKAFLR